MIKWFVYIVVLLIFTPYLSSAKIKNSPFVFFSDKTVINLSVKATVIDTIATKNSKKPDQEEKKIIKEVARAKRQPKPEKVEPADNMATSKNKAKPGRQRRPEGLERPPEIPKRNGN